MANISSNSTFGSNLYVSGNLSCGTFTPPSGSISDAAILGGANIQATKLQHQHEKVYAQGSSTTAASAQQVVHVVYGASGTLVAFKAGCVVACLSTATITVDLYKNGSSILSGTITLDHTISAYSLVAASGFTSSSLSAGDVLEVKITATAGGGTLGQGVFAEVILDEYPQ